MVDVRAICAIGVRGQLGLHGRMPWEGERARAFREDVARFFEITRGHVLVAGPRTIASVPAFARSDRTWVVIRSHEAPEAVLARYAGRVVYIGGGPAVWTAYAPWIRHWDINRLPYDGDADRWFDPQWLIAGGAKSVKA
jgi:dihydromethanopterin reductase